MNLRPAFEPIPSVKVMINLGATLDIPTGTYVPGLKGEMILNGGLGGITGIVGIGNNFKSTFMHFNMLAGAACIACSSDTSMGTYDTEINTHLDRLRRLSVNFKALWKNNVDIMDGGLWNVTDKTIYSGNAWYEKLKEFLKDKKDNFKKWSRATPFQDKDTGLPLMIPPPTFTEVDSLTMFDTDQSTTMSADAELGSSDANTLFMRLGMAKTRFLMEIPAIAAAAYHYVLITAHIGKEINMNATPHGPPPQKQLQHLKNGDVIKGVSAKFFYLMANCWHCYNAAPFINQGTKASEYPRSPEDNAQFETDLMIVNIRNLRSKSGPSGITLELMVSQSEGVLPGLTEFHYIKGNDRFGLNGSMQHYALDLLPEVKLSRTTVRSKLEDDVKLRRAMNITSELCQIKQMWHHWDDGRVCTPKELYDDLKAKGYDWDILLNTRGWWTFDNHMQEIPFLSTYDLLRMRQGLYHPYWLEEDKKTIKVFTK